MMSSVPGPDKKTKLLVFSIEVCPACGQRTMRAVAVGAYVS